MSGSTAVQNTISLRSTRPTAPAVTPQHLTPQNLLLAALPAGEYERLRPHLHPVSLERGQVLHEESHAIHRLYFPDAGVISCTLTSRQGEEFQVSLIGNEGIVGISSLMGNRAAVSRAEVQIAGDGWWIPVDAFLDEFQRGGQLQELVMRHIRLCLVETAQTAFCHYRHSLEERLSCWLLRVHDRAHSDRLDLTHEFIARMLVTRRGGISVAAGMLKQAGLIDYRRGHIAIVDRAGLEDITCECYQVIRDAFEVSLSGQRQE
jgi:CRP-like cAMP-binding protein